MPVYPFEAGYCQEDDVMTLIPNSEAYAKLRAELVKGAIADTATEIDALLGRFYLTPVSADPAALALLRVINKFLARAYIDTVFNRAATVKGGSTAWHDAGYELLDQIVPPREKDGTQPYPVIRFLLAPVQSPTELPAFDAGRLAQMNDDNDQDLHTEQEAFFSRTERMPWRDGMM